MNGERRVYRDCGTGGTAPGSSRRGRRKRRRRAPATGGSVDSDERGRHQRRIGTKRGRLGQRRHERGRAPARAARVTAAPARDLDGSGAGGARPRDGDPQVLHDRTCASICICTIVCDADTRRAQCPSQATAKPELRRALPAAGAHWKTRAKPAFERTAAMHRGGSGVYAQVRARRLRPVHGDGGSRCPYTNGTSATSPKAPTYARRAPT